MWCDAEANKVKGPSDYIILAPAWHNADSMGYNPKATGRAIESWGELFSKDFKGKVALVNIPQVGYDGRGAGDGSTWSQEIRRQR